MLNFNTTKYALNSTFINRKKIFLLFAILFAANLKSVIAQNTWMQKNDLGYSAMNVSEPTPRSGAAGFSIGSKGYVGTGYDNSGHYKDDFWEYDPVTNIWTQKANFSGLGRAGAVAFSIGTKGYLGTGSYYTDEGDYYSHYEYFKDFWEYDPATNDWTKKSSFGGHSRTNASGFSIGEKGYIGTGFWQDDNFDNQTYYVDFWEYNPTTDTWSQKADYSGMGRQNAVGFSIGTKGYIGTGWDNSYILQKDFWAFDPDANTWSQKTDFAGTARSRAVAFSMGNKGYIGTGYDGISPFYKTKDLWEYDPTTNDWIQKADFGGDAVSGAVGFSMDHKGYIVSSYGMRNFWEYNSDENTWTQKADFAGSARSGAVGFSIANKGYIGTGSNGSTLKDFWEYNPDENTWTQKADFSGTARYGAFGFSIGDKGYVGTGNDGISPTYYTKDFWEYDPAANNWMQKADFGGTARAGAVGFSIGDKGYVGTGRDFLGLLKDFWEFNPDANTWTQKTDFGGTAREAIGFSIGNKGYLGLGTDANTFQSDFWEYNPLTDSWIKKADFGGESRPEAIGFSVGSRGYVGTGGYYYFSWFGCFCWTYYYYDDFWEYTPSTNSWAQKADFAGVERTGALGFSIGDKGYVGTGFNFYEGYEKDFWEYTPEATANPCYFNSTFSIVNISSTSAQLKWLNITEALSYKVRYKPSGTSEWTITKTLDNNKTLHGLTPSTEYVWQVKSFCDIQPVVTSEWSEKQFFTTDDLRLSESIINEKMLEVYPNPISQSASVSFFLNQASPVVIEIIDVNGRSLRVIENNNFSAGSHEIIFNRESLIAGIYFLQLKTNEGVMMKKLVI